MSRRRSGAADAAVPEGPRRLPLWGRPLPAAFYGQPAAALARALLGHVVVHRTGEVVRAGRIVETEAYEGRDDPASHAWRGERPHLRHLFGPPGTVYVYRSYGVHWCANVVSAPVGHGSAVLLRALEPLVGLDAMAAARGVAAPRALASGPGKLCQAMDISDAHDGATWWTGALQLCAGAPVPGRDVVATPRIGISRAVDRPLRFLVRASAYLSRRETPG